MRFNSGKRARATKIVTSLIASGLLASTVILSAGVSSAGADTTCAITTSSTNDATQVVNNPHSMYNTLHAIGASAYYQHGYFGQGVDVALIDTGVAPVAGLNGGNVVHGPDLSFDSQNPALAHNDTFGHGTHMASIIAGRDFVPSPTYYEDPTKFQGVAPMARLVSIKVGDAVGAVDVSQVIAGIDWAVTHRHSNGLNIRVINLSLAYTSLDNYTTDALSYAATQAWKNGILVVVSAGNSGRATTWEDDNINPATNSYLLSAGSYDPAASSFVPSTFSSTNPYGQSGALFAPGQSIGGLHVTGSYADTEILSDCQAAIAVGQSWTQPVWGPDGRFVNGSGTSQAAAVVSGAAALVFSQHPGWNVDQVKNTLSYSATVPCGTLTTWSWLTAYSTCDVLSLAAAYVFNPGPVSYKIPGITGGSSLDMARGDSILSSNGATLTGNTDWFGKPIDLAWLQGREPKGDVWKLVKDSSGTVLGESWNGELLTGSGFAGDPVLGANVWTGHSWSGNDWTGHSWSGHSWSGHSWSGHSWSGSNWDSDSFTGHSWSGHAWRDLAWS